MPSDDPRFDPSRRRHLAGLTGAGLLAALPARAARRVKPAASAAPAIPLPVPLAVRERRLANGLQCFSLASRAAPAVAVQVWVRVGAKNDPEGRSGFAHLFEHLMFKGTAHLRAESFDRLTEDVGGRNNAYTAEDMTVYLDEVPSNHLEPLLWAEADRLASLAVDAGSFASERSVVIEELRQRVLADPYGRLFNALPEYGFTTHPYRRPVNGSERDLDAATLAEVRAFHAAYYRPDNAVLVVAGDFDPEQLDAWVDRYFAPIAAPTTPIPRVDVTEPRRDADRQVVLPAIALLWQGPPAAHPAAAPLEVAAALLSSGESSRLNEAMVYRRRIAQSAGFETDLYADAGQLVGYAIASSGHSPRALEAALLAELQLLARAPIAPAEMDKVRTRLLTAALVSRQTPQGLASAIGEAVVVYGDVRAADRRLVQLRAVGAADVQRVLEKYVLHAHRVTIDYRQQVPA